VTFGFRSEVFHQKCNSQGAKDRHKDDKRAPRARRRMRVGIIRRGELPEKHQIMNEADEGSEEHRPQAGYDAHGN
jgi:hypothetical protein